MKRSGPIQRRTPLRRTAIKRKPTARKPGDRVSPEDRRFVIARDGMCFWSRVWVAVTMHEGWVTYPMAEAMGSHWCSNAMGLMHPATARDELTVDHFWHDGGHMRDRAPSDPQHMVAACWALNDHGMTHHMRMLERRYAAWLRGEDPDAPQPPG